MEGSTAGLQYSSPSTCSCPASLFDCKKGSNYKSIVGTYRLIRRPMTQIHGKFYTESEFNINKIFTSLTTSSKFRWE